ncbi:MAG: transglutaminase-like cysteine peptidase, partial [Pseudomonadota bacterium]
MRAWFLTGLGLVFAAQLSFSAGPAQAERPYMDVLGATSPPIGYVELCQRQPAFCAERTSNPTVVQLDERSWTELLTVNMFVNRTVAPVTDADLYGR